MLVNSAATAFATIINIDPAVATDCGIALLDTALGTFSYQTTDPGTNAVTGLPDTPVDIAGGGSQSFVFAVTPTTPFQSVDVELNFDCSSSAPAAIHTGLNTLLMSASMVPVPDIVALAASPTNDGIVELDGEDGANAFAVATVNVGVADTITASVDTGNATLPLHLFICDTDLTGQCLTAPAAGVNVDIPTNGTPTFSVFVNGAGDVPFDPAAHRIFVRFKDGGGVTRGATSVAVKTAVIVGPILPPGPIY